MDTHEIDAIITPQLEKMFRGRIIIMRIINGNLVIMISGDK